MTMREANADSDDDSAEPAAEQDLSSLARLLHYAMCESESLGQTSAVALIDAAILSLKANDSARAACVVDRPPASGGRARKVAPNRLARAYTRKLC
jgi:hypothetical protein